MALGGLGGDVALSFCERMVVMYDIWEFLIVMGLVVTGSVGVSILSEVQKVVRLLEKHLTKGGEEK